VQLYLIRHADALALGERGITDDALRPLSDKGMTEAQDIGKTLQKKGIALDHLVTSPLLRARQTADMLLKNWIGKVPEVHVCDELAPNSKPRKLARFLRKLAGEHFGLVGHIPHVTQLAGWLLGAKKAQIVFAKAGIAQINCGNGPRKGVGELQWLVTPEWFD
jgi:phosphohistidine phosphatase